MEANMIKQFIADAFTDKVFHGNPAAICLPERWPDEKLMQDIASENRLSETAFVVKENNGWKLRWFTPGGEIDLCGHATLATAFVLMNFVEPDLSEIEFSILSGKLSVKKKNELYAGRTHQKLSNEPRYRSPFIGDLTRGTF